MGLLSGIGRLLKGKDFDFSPVFTQQAEFLCLTSDKLVSMMSSYDPAEWERNEREIKAYEVQGDAILADFNSQLNRRAFSAVTRKIDMQTLAMALDDCLDVVKDCAKAILIYKPRKIDPQLQDMSRLIQLQANALKSLMADLQDMKANNANITLQCERVTELEHAADDAYEDYVGYIFENEPDVKELIKYKNIAEVLESTTDCAKTVSDTVRRILINIKA